MCARSGRDHGCRARFPANHHEPLRKCRGAGPVRCDGRAPRRSRRRLFARAAAAAVTAAAWGRRRWTGGSRGDRAKAVELRLHARTPGEEHRWRQVELFRQLLDRLERWRALTLLQQGHVRDGDAPRVIPTRKSVAVYTTLPSRRDGSGLILWRHYYHILLWERVRLQPPAL